MPSTATSPTTPAIAAGPSWPPVFRDVLRERRLQDDRWGVQNHAPEVWIAILTEEVGEAAQEALGLRFGDAANAHGDLRGELVQVAAVAIAAIECLDRDAPPDPVSDDARRYRDAIDLARDELASGRFAPGADSATAAVDQHAGAQAAFDVLSAVLAGRPLATVAGAAR